MPENLTVKQRLQLSIDELRGLSDQLYQNAINMLLGDNSPNAALNLGLIINSVIGTFGGLGLIDVSDEDKISDLEKTINIVKLYLNRESNNDLLPRAFLEHDKSDSQTAVTAERSEENAKNEIVENFNTNFNLILDNVYKVLTNLNTVLTENKADIIALYNLLPTDDTKKSFLVRIGLITSSLMSAFLFAKKTRNESSFRTMIESLNQVYQFATYLSADTRGRLQTEETRDGTRNLLSLLFAGYNQGTPLFDGSYIPETNVRSYCRGVEKVIQATKI